jgi:hypothetical protein
MAQDTEVKKLGLNVPVPLIESLQGISATSGCTLTQLLCTGLELVKAIYEAEARGGVVLVHNQQGQAESVLTVPRKGAQQISLTFLGTLTPAMPTGVTVVESEG